MGKWLMLGVGIVLTALGVTGIVVWAGEVWAFVKAGLALAALAVGLGVIVFGIGEFRTPVETSAGTRQSGGGEAPPPHA